jgi:hypothetical protein
MELSQLTIVHAAQSKFAIAAFLGNQEMFEQAIIQFAIATGTKVKYDNTLRFSYDRISDIRRGAGASN